MSNLTGGRQARLAGWLAGWLACWLARWRRKGGERAKTNREHPPSSGRAGARKRTPRSIDIAPGRLGPSRVNGRPSGGGCGGQFPLLAIAAQLGAAGSRLARSAGGSGPAQAGQKAAGFKLLHAFSSLVIELRRGRRSRRSIRLKRRYLFAAAFARSRRG